MIIERLEIRNFRGFNEILEDLNFSPKMNIFIGINGSGKTSLLDLIAIFLNHFSSKLSGSTSKNFEYSLSQLDININANETVNRIHLKALKDFTNKSKLDKKSIDLSLELIRNFQKNKNNFNQLNEYIKLNQDILITQEGCSIPVLKYFQSQRSTIEKSKSNVSNKRYLNEQMKIYDDAFVRSMDFNNFIQWYIDEENIENREKVSRKNLDYQNPYLTIVRNALSSFFKGFKDGDYSNLRVEDRTIMSKLSEKSSLLIDKNQSSYNLKQLSEGEKNLILIVSDIALRLAIANHGSKDALTGSGIVLIDEIDLHLHPEWQRAIIPCLLSTFPNIQFFVTSHSPQVISSVDKEYVFQINDFKISKTDSFTKGRDSNSILNDVFDMSERDEHFKSELIELYKYIENGDKYNAKKTLDYLTSLWGDSDNEIVRANLYYEDLVD